MPFIRGRYHINPVAGAALEAARDAEAALLALQHEAEEADPDAASTDDDFPDGNRLATNSSGPIHRVEIEAAEMVPAHSGRAERGFVARVHRGVPATGGGASSGAPSGGYRGHAASAPRHAGTDYLARTATHQPETHVFADHRDLVSFLRDEFAKDCNRRS
jgi:hypothetical protein